MYTITIHRMGWEMWVGMMGWKGVERRAFVSLVFMTDDGGIFFGQSIFGRMSWLTGLTYMWLCDTSGKEERTKKNKTFVVALYVRPARFQKFRITESEIMTCVENCSHWICL